MQTKNEIAAYENNTALFSCAESFAQQYGLYCKLVAGSGYASKAEGYLVFSVNPIPADVNPVEIINRYKRNPNIFYPESFAIDINSDNPLLVWEGISHYLSRAEFLCELYAEFDVELPHKIRDDELDALMTFYCGRENPNYDMDTRRDYAAGLREFFKQEKSRGKFQAEWQEFYRSELFDEEKSFVKNFISFLRRKEPETSIDVLLESGSELKKTYISEHHYEEFRNRIKESYPDVRYNVSDKIVVDKGTIVDPKTELAVETQFGLCVTDKQYDKVREKRFSTEGFTCLDNLTVSHYEGRDLYYKASDENIIASILNDIRYRWAKCSSIEELKQRGAIERVDIPVSQLGNFYVHAGNYEIPFAIDNNASSNPSLNVVHVLYNKQDAKAIGLIVAGITYVSLQCGHVADNNVQFLVEPDKVETIIKRAKLQSAQMDSQQPLPGKEAEDTARLNEPDI